MCYIRGFKKGKLIVKKPFTSRRLSAIILNVANKFFGGNSGGATPVPISNTEVKSSSAYGTARVTLWESRSLPNLKFLSWGVAKRKGTGFWSQDAQVRILPPQPI